VHPKKLGPLLISATVENSNFKFGIQLVFGTILSKKQRLGPKLAGPGPGEHPTTKLGHPIFSATVKAIVEAIAKHRSDIS